ncbi:leucine-rich repeat (LRR) family protein isoform X2 [Tasmannia lanceolata]
MKPLLLSFPLLFTLLSLVLSQSPNPPPKGLFINCGATAPFEDTNGLRWIPDSPYISSGIPKTLTLPGLLHTLTTLRSFPLQKNPNIPRKFCYVFPVFRTAKYLIRTTYFYGGINGQNSPPVFDQIVEGTIWTVVNTTDDYARGMSSYYEGVFLAKGKTMSICIAPNTYTDSDPFISGLELVLLEDSVYNSTDFSKYALTVVARHSFGSSGPIVRFPDDPFDRYWQPFPGSNHNITSNKNVSVSGFWNLPPSKVFDSALTSDQLTPMELPWPPVSLPNSSYYVALYFADNRDSITPLSRVFSISINGIEFYHNLTVTSSGVVVFANIWPLSGLTKLTLTPASGSDIGPLINAGEVFDIMALGGTTITRDVIALERVRKSLQNPPVDWNGDPCLPLGYSWTGVTCSEGPRFRVVSLNLSSMGISGSLSPSIANLTALSDILLGNNNLSGSIPDLSRLRRLERLHLEDNQLSGEILPSLENISTLRELFIQNNNLTGHIPDSLKAKPGLNLQ